jgi:two-component system, OmpR family, alkaline phosphatase synthesis response regulator PhoP
MIEILLYSKNNNINKIKKAFKSESGFELCINKSGDPGSGKDTLERIDLVILDITNLDIDDRKTMKNLSTDTASFRKSGLGIILILDPDQLKILFDNEMVADSFVLSSRIENELIPRINFLLLKLKIIVPKNSLVVGDLVLNLEKYELTVNGRIVVLTFKEFEMLKLLLQNQDKVFTRINLLSTVWGYDYFGGSRTVDVHMRRLRSKVPPPYNNMLKTIRNVGYMFSQQG